MTYAPQKKLMESITYENVDLDSCKKGGNQVQVEHSSTQPRLIVLTGKDAKDVHQNNYKQSTHKILQLDSSSNFFSKLTYKNSSTALTQLSLFESLSDFILRHTIINLQLVVFNLLS